MMKKSILALALCLALISAGVWAQEATATPEAERTQVGVLSVVLPEGWYNFISRDGSAVFSDTDLLNSSAADASPIVVQARTGVLEQLRQRGIDISGELDLVGVLTALLPSGQTAVPEGLQVGGVDFARVDVSEEARQYLIYLRLLPPRGVALFYIDANSADALADVLPTLETMMADITLNAPADFPEGTLTRYEGIPQDVTEEGYPRLGNPDAPVQLVEISSFSCPHCKTFHDESFPVLLERIQRGEVAFVYVPFFGAGSIPNGDYAALAAMCANEQGKFWEYHDGIFSWQTYGSHAFAQERLLAGAEALGLDIEAFIDCYYNDEDVAKVVLSTQDYVKTVEGFRGTPTVLLNGKMVNVAPIQSLISAIDLITPR
jgi:protein-disulfide isomerase